MRIFILKLGMGELPFIFKKTGWSTFKQTLIHPVTAWIGKSYAPPYVDAVRELDPKEDEDFLIFVRSDEVIGEERYLECVAIRLEHGDLITPHQIELLDSHVASFVFEDHEHRFVKDVPA